MRRLSLPLALSAGLACCAAAAAEESPPADPASAAPAASATAPAQQEAGAAPPGEKAPPAAEAAKEPSEPTLEQFAAHPYASLPALSPDGKQIAIVFRTGPQRTIALRPTDPTDSTRPPRLLGSVRSRPLWLRWTKQERVLVAVERFQPRVYLEAMEGDVRPPVPILNRYGQVVGYSIPPQPPRKEMPAGKVHYVHSFHASKFGQRHLGKRWEDPVPIQDDVISWLPNDPMRVLINYDPVERFGAARVKRPSVQLMSVASGSLRRLVGEDRRIQRWFADHDGNVVFGEGTPADRPILYRREGRQLVEVNTYVEELEGAVRFAAHSYDPDLIYVWALVSGRQALLLMRVSDRAIEGVFAHPELDVTGPLVFDQKLRKLVGVGYVDDVPRLHALDESLALERALMERALPGQVLEYVSESDDQSLLLVRASSDVTPPSYYLYDRAKKELSPEFAEHPELEGVALAPMQRVTYYARDGLAIPAYLTRPLGAPKGGPAIVWVHDGPDERAQRRFDPLVQWLARRGFAVLEPNYRGSSGYGESFRSLGFGGWGGAMQDDLDDAAAWLAAEGIADPKRIGIYGRGYGGYAALSALARAPSLFRAAASHAGPSDLEALLEDDEKDRVEADWSRRVLGARKANRERLRALSPIAQASAISGPVLLLHSDNDEYVRFDQSKELLEALLEAGKRVELVEFPNELRELAAEQNRVLLFQRLTQFFETHLAAQPAQPATPTSDAPPPAEAPQ
jgi:dipeptidyl aminopeptidase/acylaminoacyl peptidase